MSARLRLVGGSRQVNTGATAPAAAAEQVTVVLRRPVVHGSLATLAEPDRAGAPHPGDLPGLGPLEAASRRPQLRLVGSGDGNPRSLNRRVLDTGQAVAGSPRRFSDPQRAAVTPGRLRLTRRGRLTVTSVAFATSLFAGVGIASAHVGVPADTVTIDHSIVVRPGQTLWEVAATELPDLPVTSAIAEIQVANRMNSSELVAGTTLLIPAK